jgi:hypothetical protein
LIDLWKGFKRVYLSISCDGVNEVGEYQRTGFKTEKFEENMKVIKRFAKASPVWNQDMGIVYGFQYTTTSFNIHHIFDFIDYMLEKEHINSSEEIDFYYAWGPEWISIQNMSQTEKEKIGILFRDRMRTIQSKKTKDELISLFNFMNQGNTCSKRKVVTMRDKLDEINKTSYKSIV